MHICATKRRRTKSLVTNIGTISRNMLTNFELKRLKPKLDIVEKADQNRVHKPLIVIIYNKIGHHIINQDRILTGPTTATNRRRRAPPSRLTRCRYDSRVAAHAGALELETGDGDAPKLVDDAHPNHIFSCTAQLRT